jgi:hypothetical protein
MARFDHPALRKINVAETSATYITLYEQPYDENSLFSVRIRDTKGRFETEDEIRREIERDLKVSLDPEDLTIDVPHSVSFEVDLPVVRENWQKDFTESGTVFDATVVAGFTSNLKKMRLVGPRALKGKLRQPERFFL